MRWFGWFRKKKKAVPVHPLPPAPPASLLKQPVARYPKKLVSRDFAREREIERQLREQDSSMDSTIDNTVLGFAVEVLTGPDPTPETPSFDGGLGGDSGGAGASF